MNEGFATSTIIDSTSCPDYNGVWTDEIKTCTIGNFSSIIMSGNELIIPSGTTLSIFNFSSAALTNHGQIINNGVILISNNGGTGINNDQGTISNFGRIKFSNTDGVGIFSSGSLINSGSITMTNNGNSYGIAHTHTGSIVNNNIITISNSENSFGISNFVGIVNNIDTIYLCEGTNEGNIPTDGNEVIIGCPPNNDPNCIIPEIGDFVINENCIFDLSKTLPENVIVQNNSVLTIQDGVILDMDFLNKFLKIKFGSSVSILSGGEIT